MKALAALRRAVAFAKTNPRSPVSPHAPVDLSKDDQPSSDQTQQPKGTSDVPEDLSDNPHQLDGVQTRQVLGTSSASREDHVPKESDVPLDGVLMPKRGSLSHESPSDRSRTVEDLPLGFQKSNSKRASLASLAPENVSSSTEDLVRRGQIHQPRRSLMSTALDLTQLPDELTNMPGTLYAKRASLSSSTSVDLPRPSTPDSSGVRVRSRKRSSLPSTAPEDIPKLLEEVVQDRSRKKSLLPSNSKAGQPEDTTDKDPHKLSTPNPTITLLPSHDDDDALIPIEEPQEPTKTPRRKKSTVPASVREDQTASLEGLSAEGKIRRKKSTLPSAQEDMPTLLANPDAEDRPRRRKKSTLPEAQEDGRVSLEDSIAEDKPRRRRKSTLQAPQEDRRASLEDSIAEDKPRHRKKSTVAPSEEDRPSTKEDPTPEDRPRRRKKSTLPPSEEYRPTTIEDTTLEARPRRRKKSTLPQSQEDKPSKSRDSTPEDKPRRRKKSTLPPSQEDKPSKSRDSTPEDKPRRRKKSTLPPAQEDRPSKSRDSTPEDEPRRRKKSSVLPSDQAVTSAPLKDAIQKRVKRSNSPNTQEDQHTQLKDPSNDMESLPRKKSTLSPSQSDSPPKRSSSSSHDKKPSKTRTKAKADV